MSFLEICPQRFPETYHSSITSIQSIPTISPVINNDEFKPIDLPIIFALDKNKEPTQSTKDILY